MKLNEMKQGATYRSIGGKLSYTYMGRSHTGRKAITLMVSGSKYLNGNVITVNLEFLERLIDEQ